MRATIQALSVDGLTFPRIRPMTLDRNPPNADSQRAARPVDHSFILVGARVDVGNAALSPRLDVT